MKRSMYGLEFVEPSAGPLDYPRACCAEPALEETVGL